MSKITKKYQAVELSGEDVKKHVINFYERILLQVLTEGNDDMFFRSIAYLLYHESYRTKESDFAEFLALESFCKKHMNLSFPKLNTPKVSKGTEIYYDYEPPTIFFKTPVENLEITVKPMIKSLNKYENYSYSLPKEAFRIKSKEEIIEELSRTMVVNDKQLADMKEKGAFLEVLKTVEEHRGETLYNVKYIPFIVELEERLKMNSEIDESYFLKQKIPVKDFILAAKDYGIKPFKYDGKECLNLEVLANLYDLNPDFNWEASVKLWKEEVLGNFVKYEEKEVISKNNKTSSIKSSKKKRGRPSDTDHKKDEKLYNDWQAAKNENSSKKVFAEAKGMSLNELKNALDRHRKRLEKF